MASARALNSPFPIPLLAVCAETKGSGTAYPLANMLFLMAAHPCRAPADPPQIPQRLGRLAARDNRQSPNVIPDHLGTRVPKTLVRVCQYQVSAPRLQDRLLWIMTGLQGPQQVTPGDYSS